MEWSTQQTQSCTVTGTNGDSWSGTAGTQTSNPITARTVYTLACTGLDGGHPSRSATVNIIFTFDEQ
ncbi:hypothetical protein HY970_03195 [Candidatus Kaiserbacteria bacterium]|nr:hypothetical protein [Candidatus Kaiserbacteria bacterium]